MSFLLDTDICSAYLKNNPAVMSRVMLHYGALCVSVVTVGELLTWALRAHAPAGRLPGLHRFLQGVSIVDINYLTAEKFGEIRASLFDQGITVAEMDLLNGACALVNGLTMVTHNVSDYSKIFGITIDDWLIP